MPRPQLRPPVPTPPTPHFIEKITKIPLRAHAGGCLVGKLARRSMKEDGDQGVDRSGGDHADGAWSAERPPASKADAGQSGGREPGRGAESRRRHGPHGARRAQGPKRRWPGPVPGRAMSRLDHLDPFRIPAGEGAAGAQQTQGGELQAQKGGNNTTRKKRVSCSSDDTITRRS